ncbi:MAG: hypothetical protein KAJ07_04625 [Planctomycetes bacterium]|nr:hypothetical protein [Planctomycetota bacterium]
MATRADEGKSTGEDMPKDMRETIPTPYLRSYQVPAAGINTTITRMDKVWMWNKYVNKMKKGVVIYVTNRAGEELPQYVKANSQTMIHAIGDALGTFATAEWPGRRICLFPTLETWGGDEKMVIRARAMDPKLEPPQEEAAGTESPSTQTP